MGRKVNNNTSKRIKTSHKAKRRVVNTHVDRNLANVNKFITRAVAKNKEENLPNHENPKIEAESMSFDELRKLLDGPSQSKKPAKLSMEDVSYLEALLKKWGVEYQRMAKDIRLNRMQWTARQI